MGLEEVADGGRAAVVAVPLVAEVLKMVAIMRLLAMAVAAGTALMSLCPLRISLTQQSLAAKTLRNRPRQESAVGGMSWTNWWTVINASPKSECRLLEFSR